MEQFSEAFVAVTDYVGKTETRPLPMAQGEGCWEADIDDVWSVSLNGAITGPRTDSRGMEVQPFHCIVYWRGMAAGVLNPYGGSIVVHENANEDLFIDAMRAATARAS